MVIEYDHQTVPVSQLEKSIIWYHKKLGFELITYKPNEKAILTINGKQFVNLVTKKADSNQKLSVLVIPNLHQKYETLRGPKDTILDIDIPDVGHCYLYKDIDENNLLLFEQR
ncbi:VOC family protein [Fictibacillus sp. KIGAM418]|uniref:VOC family protein n=1 Tax=Fictibacillus marinisediminis TaxID=2878389 RepID=A0A9X2BF90_9BACL|nr:VOC family protein [Fictibacillus marinisediminis]MCK6259481.1 VOC family protein [Fictibacillus marinisediminis]